MFSSLWRAIKVEPSYYTFWALLVCGCLLVFAAPLCWVGWELRGIRLELRELNKFAAYRRGD